MKFNAWREGAYLLAALLIAPAAFASMPNDAAICTACVSGEPTAQSYQWDFGAEANRLIQDLQVQAMNIRDQASVLRSLTREPTLVNWRAHADRLQQVRDQMNTMGQEMCRLQTIRPVLFPWQQAAINKIQPMLIEMADYTKQAINFTRKEEFGNFDSSVYRTDVSELYQRADQLTRTTTNLVEYAKSNEVPGVANSVGS